MENSSSSQALKPSSSTQLIVRVVGEDLKPPKSPRPSFRKKIFGSQDVISKSSPIKTESSFCSKCDAILSGSQEPWKVDVLYRFYEYHKTAWELRKAVSQRCYICSTVWAQFTGNQQQILMNLNTALNTAFSIANYKDVEINVSTGESSPKSKARVFLRCLEIQAQYVNAGIGSSTDSSESWDIAKEWIRRCTQEHELCNTVGAQETWYPTRLIDIGTEPSDLPRLITNKNNPPISGRYITLSHCWGQAEFMCLTESNLECFTQGIPIDTLSQTFQDAITATRMLGVRYIWIDSLCIIQQQPSKEDWLRESPKMGMIYSNSHCNIAATASASGSGGLFKHRDPHIVFPKAIRNAQYQSGAHIVHQHDWNTQLLSSPLLQRGWVVQERILAPRMLHFGRQQLLWECCESEASERFPNQLPVQYVDKDVYAGYKENTSVRHAILVNLENLISLELGQFQRA